MVTQRALLDLCVLRSVFVSYDPMFARTAIETKNRGEGKPLSFFLFFPFFFLLLSSLSGSHVRDDAVRA